MTINKTKQSITLMNPLMNFHLSYKEEDNHNIVSKGHQLCLVRVPLLIVILLKISSLRSNLIRDKILKQAFCYVRWEHAMIDAI